MFFSPQKEFNIYFMFFSSYQSPETISTFTKFVLAIKLHHPTFYYRRDFHFLSLMFLPLTSNKHLISPEPPVWANSNCIVSLLRPGCLQSICDGAYYCGSDLLLHYFINITHREARLVSCQDCGFLAALRETTKL